MIEAVVPLPSIMMKVVVDYGKSVEALAREFPHSNFRDFVTSNFPDEWVKWGGKRTVNIVIVDLTLYAEHVNFHGIEQTVEKYKYQPLGISELAALRNDATELRRLGVRSVFALNGNSRRIIPEALSRHIDAKIPCIPYLDLTVNRFGLHLHAPFNLHVARDFKHFICLAND